MSTAQVIPFIKPSQPKQEAGKSMYSDKFHQGYVMSSRLYRKEVWPFLSDAARNVYAELENRINGHNKESDFVSYSQLQGGELEGSRKMGSKTVTNGVKELLELGVISIVGKGKQGVKKYKLNEISLVDHFTNESSSLRKVAKGSTSPSDVDHFTNESESTSLGKDTIDSSIDSLEFKKNRSLVDKSKTEMFSESIEYHGKDKTEYSLRELAGVYTVQSDFKDQAKQINPKLDDEKIMSELKNFAQWSTSQNKTTAQGWMNFWIYRIKNLKTSKPRNSQVTKTENTKPKALSDAQISWFSSELCNYGPFSSRFANMGEKPKEFISRITANLRKPEHVKTYAPYLNDLGFVVSLEEFHAE